MKKIRTILSGSFGQSVSFNNEIIEFDATGCAEVSEELAEELVVNFPDVYYYDGNEAPTLIPTNINTDIDEDFASKFENGVVEKASVLEQAKLEEKVEFEAKLTSQKEELERNFEARLEEERVRIRQEVEQEMKVAKSNEEDISSNIKIESVTQQDDSDKKEELLEQQNRISSAEETLKAELLEMTKKEIIDAAGIDAETAKTFTNKDQLIQYIVDNKLI
jgi:hypothetical protein